MSREHPVESFPTRKVMVNAVADQRISTSDAAIAIAALTARASGPGLREFISVILMRLRSHLFRLLSVFDTPRSRSRGISEYRIGSPHRVYY
jgi:hypothetical protein